MMGYNGRLFLTVWLTMKIIIMVHMQRGQRNTCTHLTTLEIKNYMDDLC